MLRPCHLIKVGSYTFDFATEVEIRESWENLTDTAIIVLPRNLKIKDQPIVSGRQAVFKRGDRVSISLGYENPVEFFSGFVSEVQPTIPIRIKCEDSMWLLKQKSFEGSFDSISLNGLVSKLLAGTGIKFQVTIKTSSFKFRAPKGSNIAQCFEELQKTFNFYSFFRAGTLYVGIAYVPSLKKEYKIKFDRDVTENDLTYMNDYDRRVLVTVTTKKDHKSYSANAGDADGHVIKITRNDLAPDQLKAEAKRLLEKFKYTGFSGSISTFGQHSIHHGDAVVFSDPIIPDNDGTYLVKEVTRKFSTNLGLRNILNVDVKAS